MNHKKELKKLGLGVETHNKYDKKDLRVDIYTDLGLIELQKLIDYTYPGFGELVKIKSKSKHNIYLFTPTGI